MKAVFIKEFGGAENLEIREVENPPKPQDREVLIKVAAAALNRADILQRQGFYPAPEGFPQKIPGLEFAGEIVETGANATKFQIGERVFGITAGGAQAEFLLSDESLLVKIPDNLNFTEAAAVPEAFITAHDAIFTNAGLKEGETLLVHAVGSGVGLSALQLAKSRGVKVFGTSRNSEKLARCAEFGLDESILTGRDTDFAETVRDRTGGRGVDVILDLVGAKFFKGNLQSLAQKGRLILVGLVGGRQSEIDMGLVLTRRLQIKGTVLRSRSTAEKAEATAKFVSEVAPLLVDGRVKPNVDKIFKIEQIRIAHEYLESNESFGKVVLEF